MNNKEIKNRKFKENIKKVVAPMVAISTIAGATACKKSDTIETINIATPTPVPVVEEVVENEVIVPEISTVLNINDNDSIDYIAEQNYNTYQLFYVTHGITKNDIINMILVINDKYTDEEGNLLITAEDALNAYTNINTILESDDMIQTIDNINQYANGELTDENLAEVNLVATHPSIVSLIDPNMAGSEYTIESVSEYEELRNMVISDMNGYLVYNLPQFEDRRDPEVDPTTVMPYNNEVINNFLFDQEIYEYNNNRDNLDNITTNGFRWLLDTTDKNACDIVAAVNPTTITITDPETDIDLQINYRTYRNNNFSRFNIYTEADTVNYVITANYSGLTEQIPEEVITEYIRIMTVMPFAKHNADICGDEENTVSDIREIEALSNANVLTLSN